MADYDKRKPLIDKLICSWNGHNWKTLWVSQHSDTYNYVRCRRCGKDGWRT